MSSSSLMSKDDYDICKKVIDTLKSDKYKHQNDLFLEPFDLDQVPDYEKVVGPPLDITTVGQNLSSYKYQTRQKFFEDVMLIYENAIKYHQRRKDTNWIVKPAAYMLKQVQRMKKNANNPKKNKNKDKDKSKSGSSSNSNSAAAVSGSSASNNNKSTSSSSSANATKTTTTTSSSTKGEKSKKSSLLKIKLSSGAASAVSNATTTPTSNKSSKRSGSLSGKSKSKDGSRSESSKQKHQQSPSLSASPSSLSLAPDKPKPKVSLKLKALSKKSDVSKKSDKKGDASSSKKFFDSATKLDSSSSIKTEETKKSSALSAPDLVSSTTKISTKKKSDKKSSSKTKKDDKKSKDEKKIAIKAKSSQPKLKLKLSMKLPTAKNKDNNNHNNNSNDDNKARKDSKSAVASVKNNSSNVGNKSDTLGKSSKHSSDLPSTNNKSGSDSNKKSSNNTIKINSNSGSKADRGEKSKKIQVRLNGPNKTTKDKDNNSKEKEEKPKKIQVRLNGPRGKELPKGVVVGAGDATTAPTTPVMDTTTTNKKESPGSSSTSNKKEGNKKKETSSSSSSKKEPSSSNSKKDLSNNNKKISVKKKSSGKEAKKNKKIVITAKRIGGKELPTGISKSSSATTPVSSSSSPISLSSSSSKSSSNNKQTPITTTPTSKQQYKTTNTNNNTTSTKSSPLLQTASSSISTPTKAESSTKSSGSSSSSKQQPSSSSSITKLHSNNAGKNSNNNNNNNNNASNSSKNNTSKTTIESNNNNSSRSNNNTKQQQQQQYSTPMTGQIKAQCMKTISGLKRRKNKSISWFLNPVTDKSIIKAYRAKIKNPMDITTISNRLEKQEYNYLEEFVIDVRRIFANCLRFNTNIGIEGDNYIREKAMECLVCAEELLQLFLVKNNNIKNNDNNNGPYPLLLSSWKDCINVLDTLYNIKNPGDGQPTSYYFQNPVTFYCNDTYPSNYLSVVSKPMDFGTIISNLIEGSYRTLGEFMNDCKLVISNCKSYYNNNDNNKNNDPEHQKTRSQYIGYANQLESVLKEQLDKLATIAALNTSGSGSKNNNSRSPNNKINNNSSMDVMFAKPPPAHLLMNIIEELRSTKYTDKATKITEPAMTPFEKPVSLISNPDYSKYVPTPMDLQTVERKIKNSAYETPEDFEYDVQLIFKNAEVYNSPRAKNCDHLVTMAKYAAKQFRKTFTVKMRNYYEHGGDGGSSSVSSSNKSLSMSSSKNNNDKQNSNNNNNNKQQLQQLQQQQKKNKRDSSALSSSPTPSSTSSPSNKKLKLDSGASKGNKNNNSNSNNNNNNIHTSSGGDNGGGSVSSSSGPRISLSGVSAAIASTKTATTAGKIGMNNINMNNKSQKNNSSNNNSGSSKAGGAGAVVASNQPVPTHIAIARVKEGFPLRRTPKNLEPFEADCARFFKELMRHSWISAARPKFIFHVPVTQLFPDLKDAYAAKVKKPMDLTTVECRLLAGTFYKNPEEFVQDVALVFSNAIRFNKDGRDIGDPLSCSYYDASIHLLRFARWLSLELLSDHIKLNSNNPEDEDVLDAEDALKFGHDNYGSGELPPFTWRLTEANRTKSREEMENLVLKEPIEKSMEGDRYTWMEAECEKLLKALRHQTDLRYMTYFIQPNYPADYTAFISQPMDWEKVQKTLKNRDYDKFGDIIDNLRLIFTNALKYNARLKGTDTVSGRAYDAAKYMSSKLEAAINKLMLSVSDRLERERIDHSNTEREIEAAERAEEERIRAAWKSNKDSSSNVNNTGGDNSGGASGGGGRGGGSSGSGNGSGGGSSTSKLEDGGGSGIGGGSGSGSGGITTLRVRPSRRLLQRRSNTDFEIPFFDDEDDGQHEQSYFDVVKQQKNIFERQRKESTGLRNTSMTCGATIFARMLQRDLADNWVQEQLQQQQQRQQQKQQQRGAGGTAGAPATSTSGNEHQQKKLIFTTGTDDTKTTATTAKTTVSKTKKLSSSLPMGTTEQQPATIEVYKPGRAPINIKLGGSTAKKRRKRKYEAILLD